jgi:hypothetical protein
MATGEIALGWLLAFRSKSIVGFFRNEKRPKTYDLLARGLAICGWISLTGGCLSVLAFLALMAFVALHSL